MGKSDHLIIKSYLTLNSTPPRLPPTVFKQYARLKETNVLDAAPLVNWNVGNDVEASWHNIKANVIELDNEFVPRKIVSQSSKPAWFSTALKRRIHLRNRLWRNYRLFHSPYNFTKYIRCRNEVCRLVLRLKSDFEDKLLTNIKKEKKKYYGYIRKHRRNTETITSVRLSDDTITSTDEETAQALADNFYSVFRTDANVEAPIFASRTNAKMPNIVITPEEVLEKLKSSKSIGSDQIHPAMLKSLSSCLAEPLCKLFNRTVQSGAHPTDCSRAIITPIPKMTLNIFLPMNLTSIIFKIM